MNHPLTPIPARPDRIDWREEAACREYGVVRGDDPWFSDSPSERALAVAICRRCPVLTACRDSSTSQVYGVWAGDPRGWSSHTPTLGGEPDNHRRCGVCHRRTRPQGVTRDQAPGTISEGKAGYCRTCTRKGHAP